MSFNNDDSRRGFGNDRKRHFGRTARPTFDEAKFNREHPDDEPAQRNERDNRSFGERAPERREFSQERRGGIGSQAHLRRDRDDFANRPSRFNSDRPSFGERPKRFEGERNFGERREFSQERREFDKSRANQEKSVMPTQPRKSPSVASRKSKSF